MLYLLSNNKYIFNILNILKVYKLTNLYTLNTHSMK